MNRIKDLRQKKNWRQQDLADALNTTKATVSRYESEQSGIDLKTISELCNLFECTSDYLLCRSDNPNPVISDEDAAILAAYHASDLNVQAAIKILLATKMQEGQQAEVS